MERVVVIAALQADGREEALRVLEQRASEETDPAAER
jgi:hypothetical protein